MKRLALPWLINLLLYEAAEQRSFDVFNRCGSRPAPNKFHYLSPEPAASQPASQRNAA